MENKLNNLPPFYVGQKVVYITGSNMLKDSIHTVLDIKKAPCGCYKVYVCNISYKYTADYVSCGSCGKNSKREIYPNANYINSTSFRPLQESVFPSLRLKEVIKKELQLISMN